MFAARRLVAARPLMRVATRQFHVTPRRFIEPKSPEQIMQDPRISEVIRKLSQQPRAIEAIQKLGDVLRDHNIDPTKPPSKWDLMKLMADSKFREVSQTLVNEMREAGIDDDPSTFMEALGQMKKENP